MGRELPKGSRWDLHTPAPVRSGRSKYPWHKWLNGSIWYLIKGEDYHTDSDQFRRYALHYAWQHSIKLRTKVEYNKEGVWLQSLSPTSVSDAPLIIKQKFRAREEFFRRRQEKDRKEQEEGDVDDPWEENQ